ncbi:hypothetical protein DFA_06138 [Cavenderia fasciculata]|uniref:Type A von Willebrand factor domain-containing protein n=1 Tax=Cavenderia fasciculata TaxID=261658 RepID=F4PK76_CACFS|nr:uncharacterized protein DFA_06138 [Cavenderia fasciculata]EGG24000.1 hypothetical protein DFA_06138 [Cavenderia fasciculata]|eukprot:XP_004361851.1 hypothetical protein DFA_06138 [Cavenderia fasciculata]
MKKIISFFGGSNTSTTSTSSSKSSSTVSYKDFVNDTSSLSLDDSRSDYQNAHYYNYYRYIEKESRGTDHRAKSGLQCRRVLPNQLNAPALAPSTLHSGSSKFTLKSVEINSVITDTCSVSTLKKHFVNEYESPVEAFYQLPLPPQASVNGFTVEFDGKVLSGVIKEKEEAFQAYTDTIASGGQAFLGEKSADGYFTMSIGNLPPKKDVSITLDIISEIGTHLDSLHFCLHRFLFPNYSFDFKANLKVNLSTPIQDIAALEDVYQKASQITYSEDKKSVTFSTHSTQGVPNNYVVVIVPHSTPEPKALVEYIEKEKSYAVALSFYPSCILDKTPEDELNQKMECIIIVDRSGSMSGDRIESAKRALEIMMRSLNENTMFNIVSFGSGFKKLFPSSTRYNDASLEKASSLIASMDADMGGTELFEPIKDVLAMPALPEYPRQVFILTDGAVSQREVLIKYVASECNTTRIFTLGIGNGVDKELVIGLSKACKGHYEMVSDTSSGFEERVLSLLSIATQPMLSNVHINWEGAGLQVVQAPLSIRPIYNRERMMIYALIEYTDKNESTTKKGAVTVTLTGSGPTGNNLEFPITIDFANAVHSDAKELVHSLAAYQSIQDLEQLEKKKSENHKDRIVKLGKRFRLVSKHTSFVVTAESEEPTLDSLTQVNALSKLESAASVTSSGDQAQELSCKLSAPSPRSRRLSSGFAQSQSMPMKECSKQSQSFKRCEEERSVPTMQSNELLDILRQQKANGSWASKTTLKFTLPKNPIGGSDTDDIWTTIAIIAHLQKVHADKKAQWNMVVIKALKWLKQQPAFVADPSQLATFSQKASELLK